MNVATLLSPSLFDHLHPEHSRIGAGYDVATTEKGKSNPSALALVQQVGMDYFARLIVRWKTADPGIARAIVRHCIATLPHGLRVRRLCVDASNEKYFASGLRQEFAGIVPVECVVSSESIEYLGEKMSYKVYLGNLLVNTIEDGHLILPNETWLKDDFRQVIRTRGTFDAEVATDGGHADCFDAVKLALHALVTQGGTPEVSAANLSTITGSHAERPGIRNPLALRAHRNTETRTFA